MNPDDWDIQLSLGGSYYNVDGEWKVIPAEKDPRVTKKMKELHDRFPALQKAWDEYMTLYNMCCGENDE